MNEQLSKGIKYILIASFLFALMTVCAKFLSNSLNSVEIVFFRNIFGVIFILYSIYKSPLKQKGGKFWLLIFRGLAGFLSLLAFFYNISNISLGEAMTFSKTSVIFTAILAFIFLKEKLSYKAWIGVFIGFIGIILITEFDGSSLKKSDYLGLLSGIGAALAYTSVKELGKYYDTRAIVLSFMATGTIVPLILMSIANFYTNENLDFMLANFEIPKLNDWFFIILIGIFATISQILMTKAYYFAKAGIIGTVSYSDIAFSIILGAIIGDFLPSFLVVLGIIFIVISGLLVTITNNKGN